MSPRTAKTAKAAEPVIHSMQDLLTAIERFKEVYEKPMNSPECRAAFALEVTSAAFMTRLRVCLHATRLLFPIRKESR